MTHPSRRTLPGAEHTLFGGYGPFVAFVALIVAMAFLAPTVAPERDVITKDGAAPVGSSLSSNTGDSWRSSATTGVAEERHLGGDRRGAANGTAR